MKEILVQFVENKTEDSKFFVEWLQEFDLDNITKEAVFELM